MLNLFNFKDEHNRRIVGLFTLFMIIATGLFVAISSALLIPKIEHTFALLHEETHEATASAVSAELERYLDDRQLALHDIASNPLIANAILLHNSDSPAFRDYISHVLLLGEDPLLSVLDVKGEVLFSEKGLNKSYDHLKGFLQTDKEWLLRVIEYKQKPKFELAVPIYYGHGREGILVAQLTANPTDIYGEIDELLHVDAAISFSTGGFIARSKKIHIIKPNHENKNIDKYGLTLTLTTSRQAIVEQQKQLILRFITSILLGGAITFALLSILGRKLIISPYQQLANTQEELKESKSFLQLIKDSNPDLLFVKDQNFKIINANQSFLQLYPPEKRDKIIGYTTIEEYDKEEADLFLQHDRKAFEEGQSENLETILFPNGNKRTLFTQKIRFEDSKGEAFILGIGRDVTEREDLIQQLTESNQELERFAYVASHDLQEPLRMISNFTQLLEKKYGDQLDENAKRYIFIASDSAKRMQQLIDDLLEYARASQEEVTYETFQSQEAFDYVLRNVQNITQKSDATITSDPMPTIEGNPIRFARLLQNLISNAIKYQPKEQKPAIHIGVQESDTEWTFNVSDNGIGMAPEYCEQIFLPFKRLHSKSDYYGTGIGLAICRKIVEQMGGSIWAESQLGKGSNFYFTLPKQVKDT